MRSVRLFGGGRTALLLVFTLGAWLAAPRSAIAQCAPVGSAAARAAPAASVSFSCRFDATLTRTFTPPTVAKDTYRVYVTDASIDEVIAAFKSIANSQNVRGAWVTELTDPLNAFGEAGPYDGTKVARLYAGRRARVAHGPIVRDGRTVASITVVSPHPDALLTRLERGTLIIEYRIVASSE